MSVRVEQNGNGGPPHGRDTSTGQVAPEARRAFVTAMAIAIPACSLGDIALKRGTRNSPGLVSLSSLGHIALWAASNPWLAGGVVLMVIHFAAFVRALRLGPLSLVVPLRASTYIFTTLLAQYYLREDVTPVRWLGILIVLVGVTMVGLGGGEKVTS